MLDKDDDFAANPKPVATLRKTRKEWIHIANDKQAATCLAKNEATSLATQEEAAKADSIEKPRNKKMTWEEDLRMSSAQLKRTRKKRSQWILGKNQGCPLHGSPELYNNAKWSSEFV